MNSIPMALLAWYDQHRRQLPWRGISDPYATWVSETMLQQTQVTTVISYYNRFMASFPTLQALSQADPETVLKHWEGLGYYSRARNLQKGAKQVMADFGGVVPKDEKALLSISGIGPYTAGAILSIAYNLPVPAVDGNVIRVLSRLYGIREDVTHKQTLQQIKMDAQGLLNHERPGDFNQALMDLGASLCCPGTPHCEDCPLQTHCDAYANGDADELPIKTQKRPPKEMQVGVALITYANRIMVFKRKERLLCGLTVFFLNEQGNTQEEMALALKENAIPCRLGQALGEAKHVFTHRVWHMRLFHYICDAPLPGYNFVTKEELAALPLPTAMKAAKEKALALLAEMEQPP